MGNTFLRTEDPVSERDRTIIPTETPVFEDSTIRRNREPYYRNTADINLTHQFGRSDTFNLGYTFGILENDDPEVEDSKEHTPSAGLTYWFSPSLGLESTASFTRGEFEAESDDFDAWEGSVRFIKRFTRHLDLFLQYDHTYIDFNGEEEDYQIFDPSVGASYTIDENNFLSLAIGYYYQDFEGDRDSEDGLSVHADYTNIWPFRRGSINFLGYSGLDQSFFGAENLGFNVFYAISGIAEYRFTRALNGNINGSYRFDDYINDPDNREDQTKSAGAGFAYQALRWLSFNLDYTYRTVDSNDRDNEYDENSAIFRITFAYPRPVTERTTESEEEPSDI